MTNMIFGGALYDLWKYVLDEESSDNEESSDGITCTSWEIFDALFPCRELTACMLPEDITMLKKQIEAEAAAKKKLAPIPVKRSRSTEKRAKAQGKSRLICTSSHQRLVESHQNYKSMSDPSNLYDKEEHEERKRARKSRLSSSRSNSHSRSSHLRTRLVSHVCSPRSPHSIRNSEEE